MGCTIDKGMAPSKNKELKAKLEHKLYLARENPEPVFDLSECDLKQVPQGIFTLCKVFRKEVLLLHNNRLSSLDNGGSINDLNLLTILDLHKNLLVTLPQSINVLTNLRELYLNNNRLKVLPNAICDLYNLQILNLNENCLKNLPDNLGNLQTLQELSLRGNDKLTELPYKLCICRNLKVISLDCDRIKEPPKAVIENGVDCIRKYFAEKHNIIYEKDEADGDLYKKEYKDEYSRGSYLTLKEQKQADFLAYEKQNEEILKQELEIREAERLKKEKFLKELVAQQDLLESEVRKFQKLKDEDRKKFVDDLLAVEIRTDNIVRQLLAIKHSESFHEQFSQLQHEEEERLLQIFRERNHDELRKKDVLLSMEQMLLQGDIEIFSRRSCELDTVKNHVIESELETGKMIDSHLCKRDTRQNELIEILQRDEQMQRECLLKLLANRNDCESWCLVQRLRLVETQLSELTKLELEKRKMQNDSTLNDLSEMRMELAAHLIELLAERDERKQKLVKTIQDIDREQEKFFKEDLWLMRFQQLMDSMPECFRETNLDVALMQILLSEGLLNYLPYFGRLMDIVSNDTMKITYEYIREAGIKDEEAQEAIMNAIRIYNQGTDRNLYSKSKELTRDEVQTPTAPAVVGSPSCSNIITNDNGINAETSVMNSECVICMDQECQMIFVPCGHMCCCISCSSNEELKLCPMCRAEISQKIRVVVA